MSVSLLDWILAAAVVIWDVHRVQSIGGRWCRESCGGGCIGLLLKGLPRQRLVHGTAVGGMYVPSGSSDE